MTTTPSQTGETAEAAVLKACVQAGYRVLVPFGGSCRYDLVLDGPQGFQTVQVKHGKINKGGVKFYAFSSRGKGIDKVVKTYEDIDLFGVYCSENDSTYLVPTNDVSKTTPLLRIEATKNGQAKGVVWAKDYIINFPR